MSNLAQPLLKSVFMFIVVREQRRHSFYLS